MSAEKTFFGHPRGLATLFFTEMWERFSYYGMRALLLLFLVDTVENGGLGLDEKNGAAIYGLYTMFVYLLALPGGWLADNFFGQRKAVFIGGCFITVGHIFLMIPQPQTFFLGLVIVVLGVGLLKPNISGIVGGLYPATEQTKRDAGFSIFYMGINLGAFIAPLITGYIGEQIAWNYGFGVAGLGMGLGLIQYKLTEKHLGDVGLEPNRLEDPVKQARRDKNIKISLIIFVLVLISVLILSFTEVIVFNPLIVAGISGVVIFITATLFFLYVLVFEKLTPEEKKKIIVIGILFIFSALFWSGFEQAGSSLNLFAKRYSDRMFFGWEIPASWFQSVNSIFIIALSPVFAWLWITLAKRNVVLGTPLKFGWGLIFLGLGFAAVALASQSIGGGSKPIWLWLILTYFLHTVGELFLSPVGLSAMTKLAPKKLVGQMMGMWFMSTAFGNLIAGLMAGEMDDSLIEANPQLMPDLFWFIVKTTVISGVVLILLSNQIKKLMGNIR
ncbi:MAG: peptide MFS transporter [Cyclobacteriaceae bacterium]|nr:peptide MFS transporter [Cyclobacteriaceae bacterium]